MLDQMSGGRFELGIGPRHLAVRAGVLQPNFLDAAEIYEESLQAILAGLTSKTLTHTGKHYQYRGVPIEMERCRSRIRRLWQGVTSVDSALGAAKRGANAVSHGPIAAVRRSSTPTSRRPAARI